MQQPTWGYSGELVENTSLFSVVKGDQMITSGPYFLTPQEAISWGFHHYVLFDPVSIPSLFTAEEDVPLLPQREDWEPMLPLEKSFYSDLPPVLIEVKLNGRMEYSNVAMEDSTTKFDIEGPNINVSDQSLTPTLRDFYDPSKNLTHTPKIGIYKIYHKTALALLAPLEAGTRITHDLLSSFRIKVSFSRNKKDQKFWRVYTAFRFSSPQNLIKRTARINLDWPSMIVKFFNLKTLYGNYEYTKIDAMLFKNMMSYVVKVSDDQFGLGMVADTNVFYQIASFLPSFHDFIAFMSINKRMRMKLFHDPIFQKLMIDRFGPKALGDYFLNLSADDPKRPIPLMILAKSRHENNLGKLGIICDSVSLEKFSKDVTLIERISMLKTINTFSTCLGLTLSCVWDKGGFHQGKIFGAGYGTVTRRADLPFEKINNQTVIFRRRLDPSPIAGVENLQPNASWLFSLPTSCMQDLPATDAYLTALKAHVLNTIKVGFGSKMILRLYNAYALSIEISFDVKTDRNTWSASFEFGPYVEDTNDKVTNNEGAEVQNRNPLRLSALRFLKDRGLKFLVVDRVVGLDPAEMVQIKTNNMTNLLNEIYPLLYALINYHMEERGIIRVDILAEIYK